MQDSQTTEIDDLLEKLIHPDNVQRLRFVVDTQPRQTVEGIARKYFGKGSNTQSNRLFHKDYSRVRKEDITENLNRVVAQEPQFIKWLVRDWLEKAQGDIKVLRDGQIPEEKRPLSLLVTLLWLSGNEGVSQLLLEQLVKETTQLHKGLDDEKKKVANLEDERMRLKTKLAERENEVSGVEEELKVKEGELTRLATSHQTAWQLKEDAHAKELNQRTEFFAEKFKNHEARVEQEKADIISELQRNHQAALQEELSRQREKLVAHYESELTTLRTQIADTSSAKQALQGKLETLEATQQKSIEELHHQHTQQLQGLQNEVDDLKQEKLELKEQLGEREAARANDEPHPLLPSDDAFGRLLIFHYERGGTDAVERLLTLFKAYRAFMEGNNDDVYLTQVSNIDKFREAPPEGLLITSMARLLEDGANSALESFLSLRSLKHETVLRQLVGRLESPKFGETS